MNLESTYISKYLFQEQTINHMKIVRDRLKKIGIFITLGSDPMKNFNGLELLKNHF